MGGAIILSLFLSKLPILLPWSLDVAFIVASFIFLGTKIRKLSEKAMNIKQHFIIAISLCAYIFLAQYNGLVNLSVREFGKFDYLSIFIIVAIGITYFIAVAGLFCFVPKIIAKIFSWIGHLSLRLMCIQMPIFFVVGKVLKLCDISDLIVVAFIKLLIVLTIAYVIDIAFSKMQKSFSVVKYL